MAPRLANVTRNWNTGGELWQGLLLLAVGLSGCQTQGPDGSVRRHCFGYTVVTVPRSAPVRADFCVREVANWGLVAGNGSVGLGYNRTKDVAMPPDCAIYLEVQTDEQFEQVRQWIETNQIGGLCLTKQGVPKPDAAVAR